jgi:hypothetical protein
MRDRCSNPSSRQYCDYGGRGIKVDPRWQSFVNFNQDMGSSYAEGLTIERIDNDGDYTKQNCTWIPRKDQLTNTRRNIYLTLGSETKMLTVWARELGMSYQALHKRIKNGWPLQNALTTPPKT